MLKALSYAIWKRKTKWVHFFVQLCRQNDQSDHFKDISSFESSIKTFDNIFGNIFSHEYRVIGTFNSLHSNRKCAKGCKMDWTCSVRYRLWSTSKKRHALVSASPRTNFKICSRFSENAVFEKFVKILSPQNIQLLLFWVFFLFLFFVLFCFVVVFCCFFFVQSDAPQWTCWNFG